MRVLFVPDWSQGNPYQALLAAALEGRGIEVSFDSSRFTGRWFLNHRQPGDVVHLIWLHPFFVVAGHWWRSLYSASRFVFKLVVLRVIGVRIVWTVHNLCNHENQVPLLDRIVGALVARISHVMKVECESAKTLVQKHFGLRSGSKIQVIPEGNYISTYPNQVSRDEARRRLAVSQGDVVFLYFGSVRPYKCVDVLIDAFGDAGLRCAKLLVVGQPLNDEIERDVRARAARNANVQLTLRFVPDEDVQLYMNAADAVVLPFREILTSGSALLAMSFGRPVVAPEIGCIREVVSEEAGILYVPGGDERHALQVALQRCSEADLPVMGQRAYERALLRGWDNIASDVVEMLYTGGEAVVRGDRARRTNRVE